MSQSSPNLRHGDEVPVWVELIPIPSEAGVPERGEGRRAVELLEAAVEVAGVELGVPHGGDLRVVVGDGAVPQGGHVCRAGSQEHGFHPR